ncbi:MAG TPA: biopolymer transporter ExbD [Candidatus Lustribacter sp.]|jgi:biopolymer transport protein ExbD|nr:biopolymer transporter ExbD [Candidatus Lustribacter sp.]
MATTTITQEEEVMSTINITPFTDVLLVLLIIFIILASVTKEPKLPDAKNVLKVQPSEIVVLVDKNNKVQVGSQIVDQTDAGRVFHDLVQQTGGRLKTVIIKADPNADFGTILRVMDSAKNEGLTGFGLANHIEGQPEGQSQ